MKIVCKVIWYWPPPPHLRTSKKTLTMPLALYNLSIFVLIFGCLIVWLPLHRSTFFRHKHKWNCIEFMPNILMYYNFLLCYFVTHSAIVTFWLLIDPHLDDVPSTNKHYFTALHSYREIQKNNIFIINKFIIFFLEYLAILVDIIIFRHKNENIWFEINNFPYFFFMFIQLQNTNNKSK